MRSAWTYLGHLVHESAAGTLILAGILLGILLASLLVCIIAWEIRWIWG